jgi:hypothetical protein
MRSGFRLAALAAVLTALSSPAFAQWNPAATMMLGQGMGPINLMVGNLSVGRTAFSAYTQEASGTARSGSPGQAAPAAAEAARFNFTRLPEISEQVREQYIAILTRIHPETRAMFEQAFAGDAIFKQFQALQARCGLSATNVVDAVAAFSLVSWQIVNHRSIGGAQAGRAVRAQLMRAAGNTPAMLKLTNAEKQQAAEMLAFQVVMDAAMSDSFTKRSLTDKLQILRAQVREAAMKLGPDPAKLQLTAAGFAPKP